MFTGIITEIGKIVSVAEVERGRRFTIQADSEMENLDIGASVACSGVCLTVVEKDNRSFSIDAAAETLDKTTVGSWREGTAVNLERSLKLGDELGGHMVSGHVDGIADIIDRQPDGDAVRFQIRVPDAFAPYIASKGSVALDGVSLTVNEVEDNVFGVCIIPHTLAVTSFGQRQPGDKMNLEIDMLARYVARILDAQNQKAA